MQLTWSVPLFSTISTGHGDVGVSRPEPPIDRDGNRGAPRRSRARAARCRRHRGAVAAAAAARGLRLGEQVLFQVGTEGGRRPTAPASRGRSPRRRCASSSMRLEVEAPTAAADALAQHPVRAECWPVSVPTRARSATAVSSTSTTSTARRRRGTALRLRVLDHHLVVVAVRAQVQRVEEVLVVVVVALERHRRDGVARARESPSGPRLDHGRGLRPRRSHGRLRRHGGGGRGGAAARGATAGPAGAAVAGGTAARSGTGMRGAVPDPLEPDTAPGAVVGVPGRNRWSWWRRRTWWPASGTRAW